MKLSILIPVYNEEKTVETLLRKVIKTSTKRWRKEIVVVDDCSTDQTYKILATLQKKYKFRLLRHATNTGKGGAIKTALKYTTGDLILTQDADLEYDPEDYKGLLSAYRARTPVVYGSRNLGNTNRGYFLCYLCGRLFTEINNILYGSNITDINTGYKLFRADIIRNANLQVDGFDFCHEITAKVLKAGYKIKEVPINYYPRSYAEGKKVKVKDALLDLWTTIKYRFVD